MCTAEEGAGEAAVVEGEGAEEVEGPPWEAWEAVADDHPWVEARARHLVPVLRVPAVTDPPWVMSRVQVLPVAPQVEEDFIHREAAPPASTVRR